MNLIKSGIVLISAFFLVYGAVRIGVSGLLLMQSFSIVNFADLQEGLGEVANFMSKTESRAIFALSTNMYLSYLGTMGILLVIGAIGCFRRRAFGPKALYVFLFLYALLFVNFQTINPKVAYLLLCAILTGLYVWLQRKESIGISLVHER
ncbi:hypothetical protein [Alteromonas facilis]|uniref:hypothetical protein n=1 Tax=Alteromonas facilis TaxID=2048004 RepID=UPI000C282A41|nr:hypothetical protein [Alteromonas facilis]